VSRFLLLLLRALPLIPLLAWAQPDPSIVSKLREGGYVLYFRHASTDFSKNDQDMKSYEDCASQRNLTDKGRDEARAIGTHIKRLGIPIGEVYASPFCRTMETARLAFGRATATQDVRGGPADPKRYDPLRKLLGTKPSKGNAVVSSHGNPFAAVAGTPYLAEGEMAVVRPEGDSKFTVVDRVRLEHWEFLQ
jgi:hypothetical protein